jgi:predicted dehydrogenase
VLKVAIVGCGKIADSHAAQIQYLNGCEIVGVCDREPLMARQLYERFPVKRCFSDLAEMISEARPHVVHITTPPESHFDIARFCLQHGCHIYVEKPFTLDASEAERLIKLADETGLKLTAGHNCQFTHVSRRMRALIETGYLGGPPVHMESCFGYNLGEKSYARALLGDKQHWVRKLPGQLLQNIISHGIARIAEFLSTDDPEVLTYGFVSPLLRSLGETEIVDELRVIIAEKEQTTAYFTFSSQMKPLTHAFRIYGPKNSLILDQNHEILLRLRGTRLKSYADCFIPPVQFASQYAGNLLANARRFFASDFQMDAGMRFLFEAFYRSIREDRPVPIPYHEILRTARIMDAIFDQLRRQPQKDLFYRLARKQLIGQVGRTI